MQDMFAQNFILLLLNDKFPQNGAFPAPNFAFLYEKFKDENFPAG